MADPPLNEKAAAESPTTARPIDFDDEQQETGIITKDGQTTNTRTSTGSPPPRTSSRGVRFQEELEEPPPKPPRPFSPQDQAFTTLKEAFPGTEEQVIRAVLVASGGQVEPAFNALLSMSDPNFQDDVPPAQPPRPTAQQRQLQQDEMYARQLAEHYQRSAQPAGTRDPGLKQGQRPDPEDRDYSFFEDELPEIRENLRQGFLTTQTKVNKWISDFKKKIDGEDEEDDLYGRPSGGPPTQHETGQIQREAMRRNAERERARRSADRERYDEDPQVLSDNFTELELHDDEAPPPKPARPVANPDLFKPTPAIPPQTGPVDEIDAIGSTPNRQPSPANPNSSNKSKKWQPLTATSSDQIEVEDNDPFSLGDSDEEKGKDLRAEDTERLKRASMQKEDASDVSKALQEHEQSGTKNKEAEDLLRGGN